MSANLGQPWLREGGCRDRHGRQDGAAESRPPPIPTWSLFVDTEPKGRLGPLGGGPHHSATNLYC